MLTSNCWFICGVLPVDATISPDFPGCILDAKHSAMLEAMKDSFGIGYKECTF